MPPEAAIPYRRSSTRLRREAPDRCAQVPAWPHPPIDRCLMSALAWAIIAPTPARLSP